MLCADLKYRLAGGLMGSGILRAGFVTVRDALYIQLYYLYNTVVDQPTTWQEFIKR